MATIVGVFHELADADRVVEELELNGFQQTDMALIARRAQAAGGAQQQQTGLIEKVRGLGVSAAYTRHYVEHAQLGEAILIVRAPNQRLSMVQRFLRQANAKDIDILPENESEQTDPQD